ncbi:hypothetical protein Q7573_04115 [Acinetobacter pittii]
MAFALYALAQLKLVDRKQVLKQLQSRYIQLPNELTIASGIPLTLIPAFD